MKNTNLSFHQSLNARNNVVLKRQWGMTYDERVEELKARDSVLSRALIYDIKTSSAGDKFK